MDKKWFILIGGKREGPYSFLELKSDPRITPDTLVWQEGFKDWIPIRHVKELKDLFKDEPEAKPLHEEATLKRSTNLPEQEALTLPGDPSQFFLWLLVILLMILYVLYQFQKIS